CQAPICRGRRIAGWWLERPVAPPERSQRRHSGARRGLNSRRRDSEDGLLFSTRFGDPWITALLVGQDANAGLGLHSLACSIITKEDALAGRGIIGVKEDADLAFIKCVGQLLDGLGGARRLVELCGKKAVSEEIDAHSEIGGPEDPCDCLG